MRNCTLLLLLVVCFFLGIPFTALAISLSCSTQTVSVAGEYSLSSCNSLAVSITFSVATNVGLTITNSALAQLKFAAASSNIRLTMIDTTFSATGNTLDFSSGTVSGVFISLLRVTATGFHFTSCDAGSVGFTVLGQSSSIYGVGGAPFFHLVSNANHRITFRESLISLNTAAGANGFRFDGTSSNMTIELYDTAMTQFQGTCFVFASMINSRILVTRTAASAGARQPFACGNFFLATSLQSTFLTFSGVSVSATQFFLVSGAMTTVGVFVGDSAVSQTSANRAFLLAGSSFVDSAISVCASSISGSGGVFYVSASIADRLTFDLLSSNVAAVSPVALIIGSVVTNSAVRSTCARFGLTGASPLIASDAQLAQMSASVSTGNVIVRQSAPCGVCDEPDTPSPTPSPSATSSASKSDSGSASRSATGDALTTTATPSASRTNSPTRRSGSRSRGSASASGTNASSTGSVAATPTARRTPSRTAGSPTASLTRNATATRERTARTLSLSGDGQTATVTAARSPTPTRSGPSATRATATPVGTPTAALSPTRPSVSPTATRRTPSATVSLQAPGLLVISTNSTGAVMTEVELAELGAAEALVLLRGTTFTPFLFPFADGHGSDDSGSSNATVDGLRCVIVQSVTTVQRLPADSRGVVGVIVNRNETRILANPASAALIAHVRNTLALLPRTPVVGALRLAVPNRTLVAAAMGDGTSFVFRVALAPQCLRRQELVGLALNLTLVAAPPPPPIAIQKAVATASSVAAVVAAVGANPAIAVQAARVSLVFAIQYCRPQDGELDFMASPIPLSFGNSSASFYAGAVVGNVSLTAGFVLLQLLLAAGAYACGAARTWIDARALLRYPSAASIFVMALLQPTAGAAVVCAVAARTQSLDDAEAAWLLACGVAGLAACLAAPVAVAVRFRMSFRSVMVDDSLSDVDFAEEQRANATRSGVKYSAGARAAVRALWRYFYGAHTATDQAGFEPSRFTKRFRLFFHDYREGMRRFIIAEMLVCIACGVIEGVKLGAGKCDNVVLAMVALLSVYLAALIALRPFDATFNLHFALLMTAMQLAAGGCVVAFNVTGRAALSGYAEQISAAAVYVLFFKLAVDVMPLLRRVLFFVQGNVRWRTSGSTTAAEGARRRAQKHMRRRRAALLARLAESTGGGGANGAPLLASIMGEDVDGDGSAAAADFAVDPEAASAMLVELLTLQDDQTSAAAAGGAVKSDVAELQSLVGAVTASHEGQDAGGQQISGGGPPTSLLPPRAREELFALEVALHLPCSADNARRIETDLLALLARNADAAAADPRLRQLRAALERRAWRRSLNIGGGGGSVAVTAASALSLPPPLLQASPRSRRRGGSKAAAAAAAAAVPMHQLGAAERQRVLDELFNDV